MAQPMPQPMPQLPPLGQATAADVARALGICKVRASSGVLDQQGLGEDLVRVQELGEAVITQQRLQAGNLPPDANLLAIMAQVVAQQAQLQGTVAQVAAQQVQLQGTVAQVAAQQVQLQGTVAQVAAQQVQLQGTVAQVAAQQVQLQGTVAQLQGTVAQVAAQQVQLQGTVARLDARLDNTRARQQNARAEAAGPAQVLQLVPLVKERLPPAGAAAGAAHAAAVGTLPPAGMFPATWPAIATLHNQHFNALSHFYGEAFGQQGALAPRRAAFIMFIKS